MQRLNLREGSAPEDAATAATAWPPLSLSQSSESSEDGESECESHASAAEPSQQRLDVNDDEPRLKRRRNRKQQSVEEAPATTPAEAQPVCCPSAHDLLPPPGLGAEFARESAAPTDAAAAADDDSEAKAREELELSRLRQSLVEQTLRDRILKVHIPPSIVIPDYVQYSIRVYIVQYTSSPIRDSIRVYSIFCELFCAENFGSFALGVGCAYCGHYYLIRSGRSVFWLSVTATVS